MEICTLEHIKKKYRMGELVCPLKDVSLTVNTGDFITVEGPSGIGKSTLLYVMGTLLQGDGGVYRFEEKDISRLTDKERSRLRAKKIGFLFQDSTMIQALTLRENLLFAQRVGEKKRADKKRVDELLERFGLSDRGGFFPYQLSGGQRRRAMAARCLIHNPLLILADEPTNDLDAHWSEEIVSQLKEESQRGAGVVMVTHDSRWTPYTTCRLLLRDGVLMAPDAQIEKKSTESTGEER